MGLSLIIGIVVFVGAIVFLTWLNGAQERLSTRLDEIDKDMYYAQADRDGCEYPPQYKGH